MPDSIAKRIECPVKTATPAGLPLDNARKQSSARSFYRPELDILRFFAFFAVFTLHTANYSVEFLVQHRIPLWAAESTIALIAAGRYGVDLFFALSAYLITELLLREREAKGSLNVRAFYVRRILRIWPLYYVFIPAAALIPLLNPQHEFGLRYVIPFFLLIGNWSIAAYGLPVSAATPLWSVSVEEQFYLLWPPLVARLSRAQMIRVALTMIVVANAARGIALTMHADFSELWFNTFAHLDSIAGGILTAALLRGRNPHYSQKIRVALIISAVVCLALRGHFLPTDGKTSLTAATTLVGDPFVSIACTAILLGFVGLPFRSVVLQYLGKISYGLYVYHVACLIVIDKLMPGGNFGPFHACLRIVFTCTLTIAVAATSYQVLEKPFLNFKRRFEYIRSRPA